MIDYELIDSGNGRRLERFGKYLLDRPDPEVLWKKSLPDTEWQKSDAIFRDKWILNNKIPEKWQIEVDDLKFWLKLSPFKHVGIFPEQLFQWQEIYSQISNIKYPVSILNLFAYTGVATMFAAKAGARVTHVDSSKPAITWANENRELNGLSDAPVRWIVDDAMLFTDKEIKRGNKYDAIIMDPPVYGHGPTGKPWNFQKDFPKLLANCQKLLSDRPFFVLINAYAVSTSPITLENTLRDTLGKMKGIIEPGELILKEKSSGRKLSTGIWAKWTKS